MKELLEQMEISTYDIPIRNESIDIYNNMLNNKVSELHTIGKQRDSLHDFLEKGIYTIEVFLERQRKLAEKESQLQKEIGALELKIDNLIKKENTQTNFVPELKNVIHAYESTDDIGKKNALLKSVLEKATLYRSPDSTAPDDFRLTLYPRF